MNSTTVVDHVQRIAAVRADGAAQAADLQEALRSTPVVDDIVTNRADRCIVGTRLVP